MKHKKSKHDPFEQLMRWFRKTEYSEELRLKIIEQLEKNKKKEHIELFTSSNTLSL